MQLVNIVIGIAVMLLALVIGLKPYKTKDWIILQTKKFLNFLKKYWNYDNDTWHIRGSLLGILAVIYLIFACLSLRNYWRDVDTQIRQYSALEYPNCVLVDYVELNKASGKSIRGFTAYYKSKQKGDNKVYELTLYAGPKFCKEKEK